MDSASRLVGDIGGTNARFGLASRRDGRLTIEKISHLATGEYPTAQSGILHYLESLSPGEKPADAVLACAGPVVHGTVDFTNVRGWQLDEEKLAAATNLNRVKLINDFEALSLAVPALWSGDLRPIGSQAMIDSNRTVSLIGPGTGTGVGARVVYEGVAAVLVTEGGHIAFAPDDEIEREISKILTRRFGRTSLERILCGQGIVNLHLALAEIEGRQPEDEITPGVITEHALAGDRTALSTMNRFFAILGGAAGDIALAHGAWGGVILAGGILPRVPELFIASDFRARFEDKGRMSRLVRDIPTSLLITDNVALKGSASAL